MAPRRTSNDPRRNGDGSNRPAATAARGPSGGPASHGDRDTERRRRKTLSQNLLTDPSIARRLVRSSAASPGDLVVEPGAGDGMITRHLDRAGLRVLAYELDPAFARRLDRRYTDRGNVRVQERDFLTARMPHGPFHVVGNIPFSRTADIVRRCLESPTMRSAALLTQLEYARKRTGHAGRWSKLTVETWPVWEWRFGGRVARDRFHPAPRVDGGIVLLRRRDRPLIGDGERSAYRRTVELGFSGVGGSLAASLRRAHPRGRVGAALDRAGVHPAAVVASVSPAQWTMLVCHLLGIEEIEDAGTSR